MQQRESEGTHARPILTGHLGDVMKESAHIAISYARAFLLKHRPENRFFNLATVHLHVPEGATPKDGPSAGITMVTALLSLALNQPLRQNVAMTGELSLTGKVLPIGGTKEKIVAAKLANISNIILPSGNRKDYEALPDFLRQGISVAYASTYDDVFRFIFNHVPATTTS